jgi:major membrane immunogen (membrane-anchored lipoprotein)
MRKQRLWTMVSVVVLLVACGCNDETPQSTPLLVTRITEQE